MVFLFDDIVSVYNWRMKQLQRPAIIGCSSSFHFAHEAQP